MKTSKLDIWYMSLMSAIEILYIVFKTIENKAQ